MMNPHFIFNTLGSIQNYLLQKKSSEAAYYLSQFARLIRMNINSLNSGFINLEEEVNRLRIYLDLEKFRMQNKFDYKIELQDELEEEEVFIPSMLIQPFVENAIWHGISPLDGTGTVLVSFKLLTEKSLKITVEDNGIGMHRSGEISTPRKEHLHLSMGIIRKRLLIMGKKMDVETNLEIKEAFPGQENPGTRINVVVPLSFEGH
jgi:LytS/YehU family sensor histidine kinase